MYFTINFDLIEKIGEGGFGAVWKGKIQNSDELLAVKYLTKSSEEDFERFKREARILYKLSHCPNIVKFYGYNEERPNPYILMEYCSGGNLSNYFGRVTPDQCLILMFGLIQALKAIHEAGGFHRDIKPMNILLQAQDGGFIAKLSDFGLARDFNPGSNITQSPRGTFKYMAPEVLNDGIYTQKADIYSLGLTMYEVMTGNTDKTYEFSKIPIALQSLLRSMYDDKPQLRPSVWEVETRLIDLISKQNSPIGKFINSVTADHVALTAIGAFLGLMILKE